MAGVCAHAGFNRCWPCMTGQCYEGPTYHVWYDDEDIEAYKKANKPLPEGRTAECGCRFCGWPAIEAQKKEMEEKT